MTTIYPARKIVTHALTGASVTHVAVEDGRILGAGSLADLQAWGPCTIDRRFEDKILLPGFVEGHSHTSEGTYWRYVYCGYYDRMDPSGRTWPAVRSVEELQARLRDGQTRLADASAPLPGWGLDPIFYPRRVVRADLDAVSTTRCVAVLHASSHAMTVNSCALDQAALLRPGVDHPGIPLGTDGLPSGELVGHEAMELVGPRAGFDRKVIAADEPGLRLFGKLCVRKGVTTAADMASLLPPDAVDMMLRVTGESGYPVRVVSLRRLQHVTPAELVHKARDLRAQSTDRLRLGRMKIVLDGSIQGYSARVAWPGYVNGKPNGLWYIAHEDLQAALELALDAGLQVHVHANGDEAVDLMLDCMERALRKHPGADHRYTVQHAQLASASQFRRMRALGLCANLFANHLYFWGDAHRAVTVGPERAARMNACATALAQGVPLAIHSDAPVTPLGPLFTAWCAVNRQTASGFVLGERERIDVAQALHAITVGAAYTLHLDGEVGTIECGKQADFAVLEDDPYEAGPDRLKDVRVWGTVQGGRIFEAASQ